MSLRKWSLIAMLVAYLAFAAYLSVPWLKSLREKGVGPASKIPVQYKNPNSLAVGTLLVANEGLGDPSFAGTVILMVHFDEKGAVGLVLNRRSTVPLSKVLDLKSAQDRTDPVYLGGPMEPTTAFALYQSQAKIEKAETVFSGVYLISDKDLFEQTISAKPDPKVFRVYLGYAGWTQDQLRAEVKLGAWYIFPADAGSVFASDPDSLWQQMIRNTNLMQARTEAFTPIRSVDNSPRRVPHRWAVQKPLSPRLQARAAATSVMRTTPG